MPFDVTYNKEKMAFECVGRSGFSIIAKQPAQKGLWSILSRWNIKPKRASKVIEDNVKDYLTYNIDSFDPYDNNALVLDEKKQEIDQSFPDATVLVYRKCGKCAYKVELYDSHKDVGFSVDVEDITFGISLPNVDFVKKIMPIHVTHEMATTLPLIAKMLKLVSGTASASVYTTAVLEFLYNCFAYYPGAEVDTDIMDIYREFEIYNLASARGTLNIFVDKERFLLILKDLCLDIKGNKIQNYKRRKTPLNQNIPLFHKIQKLYQHFRMPIHSLRKTCEITPDIYHRLTTNVSSNSLVV